MKLKFLFSIALTLSSLFIQGQSEALLNASHSIKIDELKEKMYKYASDEFEGKDTPSKGQELAVSYLANHYKKLNIPPVKNNSYFQHTSLHITCNLDLISLPTKGEIIFSAREI